MKWAIKLGEHDIKYMPRTAIKGQTLADFLVKSPQLEKIREAVQNVAPCEAKEEPIGPFLDQPISINDEWTLFIDGSSCEEGGGAGSILSSPAKGVSPEEVGEYAYTSGSTSR